MNVPAAFKDDIFAMLCDNGPGVLIWSKKCSGMKPTPEGILQYIISQKKKKSPSFK